MNKIGVLSFIFLIFIFNMGSDARSFYLSDESGANDTTETIWRQSDRNLLQNPGSDHINTTTQGSPILNTKSTISTPNSPNSDQNYTNAPKNPKESAQYNPNHTTGNPTPNQGSLVSNQSLPKVDTKDHDKTSKGRREDLPHQDNSSNGSTSTPGSTSNPNLHKEKGGDFPNKLIDGGVDYDKCNKSSNYKCSIGNIFYACLLVQGSTNNSLVLKNEGKDDLVVKVKTEFEGPFTIRLNGTKKMNFTLGNKGKIVLSAMNENCSIHRNNATVPSLVVENTFPKMLRDAMRSWPSPLYSVYFLCLSSLIIGGTWACCKFGRKRHRTESLSTIPYQELEMGLAPPLSAATNDDDAVNGWDQDWDDDWEEDNALQKMPRSGATNGIASSSSNKEGWDDWDD